MALLGTIMKVALVLVGVLVVIAGVAYATDYGVKGSVDKKSQSPDGTYRITLGLDLGPSVNREVEKVVWDCLREGNYVVYHIRSEHTLVYRSKGGALLYDSKNPLTVTSACSQDGGGDGGGFPFVVATNRGRGTESSMNREAPSAGGMP